MPDRYGPYNEETGGVSPSSGGFSRMGGGRWVERRLIGNKGDGAGKITAVTQLWNSIKEILGYTGIHTNGVSIHRDPPKACAIFPWLYAERISNIVGKGQFTKTNTPGSVELGITTFDQFALYETYELTIEYSPRPYSHGADTYSIAVTWNKPDGSSSSVNYAQEWQRYTHFAFTPAAEWITAEAGGFQFDVASAVDPNGFAAGKGQIKMLVPQNSLKATWHEVPYKFVDGFDAVGTRVTSYVEQGLGCVNQYSWRGYPAGSLLFAAVNVSEPYSQPIPDYGIVFDTKFRAPALLCDITFVFTHRNPTLGKDAGGSAATPSAAVNANAIQAGHNYFPLAHMGSWYYAKTTGISGLTDANNRPAFPSFPFELLWTNPGVT